MVSRLALATRWAPALAAAAALTAALLLPSHAQAPGTFAERVARLSEPGGYFDTDNLISNERAYLDVLPDLARRGVRGGAYIGVGPDQNFSYIAAVRPSLAFIVDIRRDNLLLHLLFKALFELAGTRAGYVSLLFGRRPPPATPEWTNASIERILAYADEQPARDAEVSAVRAKVDAAIARFGVPLSNEDRRTIDRFHREFIQAGSSLRFQSAGRPPRPHYPTYRDLLVARDASGNGSFLASEEAFRFLKELQARNGVVPVVGDVSGAKALAAVAHLLDERRERLSAFYISNVEFYLFRQQGRFARYVDNLSRLPHDSNSVIIRSVFGSYAYGGSAGYSSSHVQPLADLLERSRRGTIAGYGDLVR
jgi:hypothetical protein